MSLGNKISVCIATYNGEKYIQEQLSSILDQLKSTDEVIISDDYSTDSTIDIIRSIGDNRIKIFFNDLKRGYSKNFENAIKNASGDFIFLSDQDDVWMNNKVELMVEKLLYSDIVISDALISDVDLKPTYGSHFSRYKTKKGFFINWLKTRYIGACMAFRKDILIKVLPFPENQRLCAHDYWIANVGEFFYRVELVDLPLIKYRRHDENASFGGEKSTNPLLHKVKVRFYTLIEL